MIDDNDKKQEEELSPEDKVEIIPEPESKEEGQEASAEQDANKDEEQKPRGKRAQRRIRALVKEKGQLTGALGTALDQVRLTSEENERLKQNLATTREATGTEISRRLDEEQMRLKTAHSLAVEQEDNEALFEIRSRQGEISAEKVALRTIQEEEARKPAVEPVPVRTVPAQLPTQGAEPEPAAEDWQEANPWFNDNSTVENQIKSAGAMLIHKSLLQEGFNPQDAPTEGNKTSDYYLELDKRLNKQFQSKAETETRKPGQTVVGGTRTSGEAGPKKGKVRLTQSEFEFTQRTGIDPVEYAREKAKIAARSA